MASTLLLAQAGGGYMNMLPIFAIIVVMYFILVRPQQKQLKEHRDLLSSLKKGDDVVTQGGMLGKIYAITDKIVTLEIGAGTRVRVLKTSVQGKTSIADEVAGSVVKIEEKKEEK